jgi:hypothetical protein
VKYVGAFALLILASLGTGVLASWVGMNFWFGTGVGCAAVIYFALTAPREKEDTDDSQSA